MRAGQFNFKEWMNKLYEEVDENEDKDKNSQKPQAEKSTTSSEFMDGGEGIAYNDGIVIPDENKKSYDWLKKEFQKGKVEVKVEMKLGGSSFTPVNDMQADPDSVKDFKPGMFGAVKTTQGETPEPKSPKNKKEDTPAEDKKPEGDNEAETDTKKEADKTPKAQAMKLDATKKKEDDK